MDGFGENFGPLDRSSGSCGSGDRTEQHNFSERFFVILGGGAAKSVEGISPEKGSLSDRGELIDLGAR